MGGIVSLAIKDLRLLVRDRMGMFFVLVFPIIMGVFFGVISGSFASDSGGGSMKVGIIDNDDSEMSRKFVQWFGEIEKVTPQTVDRQTAVNLVRRSRMAAYVALPKGFGETAGIFWADTPPIEIGVDPSRGAEGAMLQGFVMQTMGRLVQERFNDPQNMRAPIQDAIRDVDKSKTMSTAQRLLLKGFLGSVDHFFENFDVLSQNPDGTADGSAQRHMPSMELAKFEVVEVTAPPSEREKLLGRLRSKWDISFPAAIMWGVMGCVVGFATSMVRERTEGTFLRLTVAPIPRVYILAGKALACFISVIGVITFMMVLGKFLGIQLSRPGLLVPAAVCVALGFVGVMMLLSVIGKTEQAVAGAGWAIIVLMCMFGGGMLPLVFLPPFMQTMSHFSPVKWGILALEGAVWRGFTVSEMMLPCGILVGIGAVCFAAGSAILKRTPD